MATKKITELTAIGVSELDNTILFAVVDNATNTVKMTFAQLRTWYNAITSSAAGDVTVSVNASGVGTFTIGALKVVTSMIANLGVTTGKIALNAVNYAQMQQVAQGVFPMRQTSGTGNFEDATFNSTYFSYSGGVVTFSPAAIAGLANSPTTLGSDQTRTANSFANVTGLSLAVAASTKYYFEFIVIWTTNGQPTGVPKFSATVPASPTAVVIMSEIINDTTGRGTDNLETEMAIAGDGNTAAVSAIDVNTNAWARVYGWLSNGSNAGNIQLRFASADGTSTITVKAGSFGRLQTL